MAKQKSTIVYTNDLYLTFGDDLEHLSGGSSDLMDKIKYGSMLLTVQWEKFLREQYFNGTIVGVNRDNPSDYFIGETLGETLEHLVKPICTYSIMIDNGELCLVVDDTTYLIRELQYSVNLANLLERLGDPTQHVNLKNYTRKSGDLILSTDYNYL